MQQHVRLGFFCFLRLPKAGGPGRPLLHASADERRFRLSHSHTFQAWYTLNEQVAFLTPDPA